VLCFQRFGLLSVFERRSSFGGAEQRGLDRAVDESRRRVAQNGEIRRKPETLLNSPQSWWFVFVFCGVCDAFQHQASEKHFGRKSNQVAACLNALGILTKVCFCCLFFCLLLISLHCQETWQIRRSNQILQSGDQIAGVFDRQPQTRPDCGVPHKSRRCASQEVRIRPKVPK
jgi:hypothetical protein